MTNLAKKPPIGLKEKKPKKNRKYVQEVRQKKCCVCQRFGETQRSPTQAHHCIHDRFGTLKRADIECIPLCEGHHQGLFDKSKLPLHQHPKLWRETYGPDYSYLDHSTEK
jgi:hypothetical protein